MFDELCPVCCLSEISFFVSPCLALSFITFVTVIPSCISLTLTLCVLRLMIVFCAGVAIKLCHSLLVVLHFNFALKIAFTLQPRFCVPGHLISDPAILIFKILRLRLLFSTRLFLRLLVGAATFFFLLMSALASFLCPLHALCFLYVRVKFFALVTSPVIVFIFCCAVFCSLQLFPSHLNFMLRADSFASMLYSRGCVFFVS